MMAIVSRAFFACQKLSATTATPSAICTTCFTPGMALALVASKLTTLPPMTGHCASDAYSMPGSLTSIPNPAVPFTFHGVSRRLVALPMIFQSPGSLSFTSFGTGCFAAASASLP
ncbi:MAG: hypothetical protein WDN04_16320 [Rhodospirillales bacterium]